MFTHFTSDLHFGHTKVIDYSKRPFASVEEMNWELVRRYNAIVSDDAFVLFVGDVALCDFDTTYGFLRRMNGRKALVLGNHDRSPAQMACLGFEFVTHSMTLSFGSGEHIVRVSHKPYDGMGSREITRPKNFAVHVGGRVAGHEIARSGGDSERVNRLPVWPRRGRREALLHGHTHSKRSRDGMAIHVGVDAWDYAPAPLAAVQNLLDEAFNS